MLQASSAKQKLNVVQHNIEKSAAEDSIGLQKKHQETGNHLCGYWLSLRQVRAGFRWKPRHCRADHILAAIPG